MTDRRLWKLLRWAARIIGCLATVAVIALALGCLLEGSLSAYYGDTGLLPTLERKLALSLAVLLAVLAALTLMTRRTMGTDSWREALRWTAASFWQGVKAGLVVFAAIAAATLLVTGLWARSLRA